MSPGKKELTVEESKKMNKQSWEHWRVHPE